MKFLSSTRSNARNECILASVVRMAGWLEIPVIMEGVETTQQVEFLKSIGCGYVQGYYYAKPMPVSNYENLIRHLIQYPVQSQSQNHQAIFQTVWSSDAQIDLLFHSIPQPAAIFEFENDHFNPLRVNSRFNDVFGYGEMLFDNTGAKEALVGQKTEFLQPVLDAFRLTAHTHQATSCALQLQKKDGTETKMRLDLQYWGQNEITHIVFVLFSELPSTDIQNGKK